MTGHDFHRDCCPLLRYYTEGQRLMDMGLTMGGMFTNPCVAIVIGRLRQQYGCPGPGLHRWACPWNTPGAPVIELSTDVPVPWLQRKFDDGRPMPGHMV